MFEFEVKWYDESKNDEVITNGIVSAETFQHAMEKLTKYFGETEMSYCHLEFLVDPDDLLIYDNDFTSIKQFAEIE